MDYISLTKKFFDDHPYDQCPEFLQKTDRPYIMIRVKIANSEFAIPFRSHIKEFKDKNMRNNQHVLKTKNGDIAGEFRGIDYSKAVIITNPDYYSFDIYGKRIKVDPDEHAVILKSKSLIEKEMLGYVDKYKRNYHKRDVQRNQLFYAASTLQYYLKELELE